MALFLVVGVVALVVPVLVGYTHKCPRELSAHSPNENMGDVGGDFLSLFLLLLLQVQGAIKMSISMILCKRGGGCPFWGPDSKKNL